MGDPDPIAVMLKFGFLAVLYLFLLWIARSAMRDLRRGEDAAPAAAGPGMGAPGGGHDGALDGDGLPPDLRPRLEVVAAKGHEPGHAFAVRSGAQLGRSESADVPIDDSFASASHARIYPSARGVFIEDLGSTNGTYVNGRQITRPLQLEVDDTVRIGDTELRYRE
ncbi:MAG: FHA domain-containing protein [Thermoleophilaceae bacterium]|jgi:hypothetical protein|nr:FHA domain-containing protein [Thermoleophilaceae bacterium]MDQ3320536.1 FHA domain-containing protein [Actinomycetota bacterium]